jgi:hypothetical protein
LEAAFSVVWVLSSKSQLVTAETPALSTQETEDAEIEDGTLIKRGWLRSTSIPPSVLAQEANDDVEIEAEPLLEVEDVTSMESKRRRLRFLSTADWNIVVDETSYGVSCPTWSVERESTTEKQPTEATTPPLKEKQVSTFSPQPRHSHTP